MTSYRLYREIIMQNPKKLRELACWYREFAERAGNPVIWEARLHTAADLDSEAERIEQEVRTSLRISGRALPSVAK
jgi:hypothetical protein